MTKEDKQTIDNMTHYQIQEHWRNAPIGDKLLRDDTGDYFADVLFKKYGGFTVASSKAIGWDGR